MVCTRPITIRNPKSVGLHDRGMQVPCGKCLACRIAKKREWKIRLMHESYFHDKSIFVTFTYDDDNIPENGSLSKRDIQLWLKRFRKSIPVKIVYYLTGEYGDVTARPHYHAIIFGVDESYESLILETWNKGMIKVGNVEHDSIQYVCGYIEKKLYGELADKYYNGRQVPFALISKGLGRRYALAQQEAIRQTLSVKYKGKEQGLPRYYAKVLDLDPEEFKEKSDEYNQKIEEFWINKGSTDILYSRHLARLQNEKNIEARLSLNKKDKI